MNTVRTTFLSWHYGDKDRELVRTIEGLLGSHNLRVVTGEDLGGGALTPEIMERIEQSDSLVALMTKSEQQQNYCGTHPWVVEEYKHAKLKNKPAIALVEPGVELAGFSQGYEWIKHDDVAQSILKLSKTIGKWKEKAGECLKVQLLPQELADAVASNGAAHCRFSFYGRYDTAPRWRDADAVPEGDGTYLFLKGMNDELRIQVRVEVAGSTWTSRVLTQSMPIKLEKAG